MQHSWEKNIREHGYNYLDGSIQCMAELFDTRVENTEKYDSSKYSLRNRKRRISRKGLHSYQEDSGEDTSGEEENRKKFCNYNSSCGRSTDECTTLKTLIKHARLKKTWHNDKEKMSIMYEVNMFVGKKVKKALKKEKRKHTKELCAYEKMSVLDSDQWSIMSSSSDGCEIWKIGLGKFFDLNTKHSSKK